MADLALDWIPGVGLVKLGVEASIGVHLLTGRSLTPFERVASGAGAVLNLFGLGWLKNLKSVKHSKVVGQQVNRWFFSRIGEEPLAKVFSLLKGGQLERTKESLRAFFQSVGGYRI